MAFSILRKRQNSEDDMDELISRITASVGIDADTAQKAVGMILGFLQKEGPADQIAQMMAGLPGAEDLIANAPASGGGMFGGGVMGLGSGLMGLGLGMGEISGVAKQTVAFAKEKAGDGPVDTVIASIPGLSQFV
ncbi:MAG: DUF2780 domain-containing protein [Oricola sp.]